LAVKNLLVTDDAIPGLLSLGCRFIECKTIKLLSMKQTIAQKAGRLIRKLRQEKGLSQEEFAALCKLHRTYMGALERGEKNMTIATAEKITNVLDIPLSDFFAKLENME
jgi:DNA-binding XRE family transcriptional regulator